MNSLYLIGGVLLVVVIVIILIFNKLVRLRQNVRESWSAIDTELKRRYDLIPNLVETVKGYAGHEKQTLESVVAARSAAVANNGSPVSQVETESALTGSLKQLFAIAESYPQLKADKSFQNLQEQLSDTESRISSARRFYNANVREMNTATMTFPNSMFANAFGFGSEKYFEIEDPTQREAAAVKI